MREVQQHIMIESWDLTLEVEYERYRRNMHWGKQNKVLINFV